MKPWCNHVQWVSVTNVLKHLRTRQYRSSQQTWWNIYHIYHSCNLCGWRHSTKYITKHNLVDFHELDKNMERIHHGMTLMELDVKVHKSPEPTIWLWNYLEVITYKKGVDVLSLDRFGWSHVTLTKIPISKYLKSEGWHGFTNNTDNPPSSWWGQWAETLYSIEISI